jgi:hypothetical protein
MRATRPFQPCGHLVKDLDFARQNNSHLKKEVDCMKAKWLASLSVAAFAACAASYAMAGEGDTEFKSGLQPGERPGAFQTRDITGPNKGKSLCYV